MRSWCGGLRGRGSGALAVHVPLGVALFGASAVLVAQVWSPARRSP
ncbi:hypothetical protein AB0K40_33510 [Nonomuraea bangladeshensis]|uniref:Uncharacterized protein n=1 Tax=Nonomuraea bangladeshensis TaxID=404385 RepID=A0ABV3HDG4_9ACTN